jgi:hypothetical protein
MLLAWVVFPLALALVGAGWGLLARELLRLPLDGALVVPFGIAVVIVAAGLLTSSASTAPVTVVVIAAGAGIGLARHARKIRPDPWAVVVAVSVLAAFGAPVLLSGQATFAGYMRLDDTATWLGIVDQVMGHSRSLAGLAPSSYALNLHEYLSTMGYPLGAFLPFGVGRALVGVDAAWVFQPYLAFCGALIGLSVYSLSRRLIAGVGLRTLVAFLAAQPALLYGYSLWGGIKELAAAFLLPLLAILAGTAIGTADRRRTLGGLAVVSAALAVTLGPGAIAWLVPALGVVAATWLWRAYRSGELRRAAIDTGVLGVSAAALMLPMWLQLSNFIRGATPLFASAAGAGSTGPESALANLLQPLSVFQLAGIWPVGDFRTTAPAATTVPFLAAVAVGLALAIWVGARRLKLAFALYPALALIGCLAAWLAGSSPWAVGKTLAIGSPALLTVALVGAAMLWRRSVVATLALVSVIGGGVLWSNALAYHDVLLAPKARLAELQRIAPLVAGHGPTLINEYEIYADRHFLRDGAPIEPAEYRPYTIPLLTGQVLTKSAYADLDGFSLATVTAYPSIVTGTSPVASRPPSIYTLRWQGHYYQLWQRRLKPNRRIVMHVPLGDAASLPFCGQSTDGYLPQCPVQPVAIAPCPQIMRLAAIARPDGAKLVAYQRPAPIVARGDQTQWPRGWGHDAGAGTLTPTTPGQLVAHIAVASNQHYQLWLGGSFGRGFDVTVDANGLGRVKDELANIGQYVSVGTRVLSPGTHVITLRYPGPDLTPGSGAEDTILSAIVLEPMDDPGTAMLTVNPSQARTLCGRELDWIEVVAGS